MPNSASALRPNLASAPRPKPLLRGHSHQAAFFVALGACAMLVSHSHSLHNFVAAWIYSCTLLAMYGISALYHRPNWRERGRVWMKRLDHAAIYGTIAGTGTPIALIAMPYEEGAKLMIVMWTACALGMLKSLFWVHSPKWLGASLYIAVGWIYAYYFPELARALSGGQMALLLAGGTVYTLGALIYAFKRPNPSPAYFGYHEIFHVFVIAASIMHFLVIRQLVV